MKKVMQFFFVVLIIFLFLVAIQDTDGSGGGVAPSAPKPAAEQHGKWVDILQYIISEHLSNGSPVDCQSKTIDGRTFILCRYEISGYSKKALFVEGGPGLYAVNGTARDRRFVSYTDVAEYPGHDIDIMKVLKSF